MMDIRETEYLSRHPFLRTHDLDESRALMGELWDEHEVVPTSRVPFTTLVNHAQIGGAGLSFVSCQTPLLINRVSDSRFFTIVFHGEGATEHTANGQVALATPESAVFWTPEQELVLRSGAVRLLALQLPRSNVEAALRLWDPAAAQRGPLRPSVDVRSGAGSALRSLCRWTAGELNKPDSAFASGSVSAQQEQILLSLFVQSLTSGNPLPVKRDQLGRARLSDVEDWIQANLREPISVETLAIIAGVSPRALQTAFRRQRDCTPMEFVRNVRLYEVRRQLLVRGPEASVTAIAMEFGFLHLGHFGQAYRRLFGESPSDTRRRMQTGSAPTPDMPAD